MKDKNGKIYRRIPMHPVVKEAIQENRQQFIEQFGREPNSNDRVIFDKISQRRIDQVLSQAFADGEIDPAYFYAYQKTGLFVWEGNVSLLPDKDVREWKSAVREFRRLQKQKLSEKESETQVFFIRFFAVARDFERSIVFFRCIVRDHGIARNIKSRQKGHSFHDFMLFCATKTLKSLGAIELLVKEGYGEDALSLARSVYESYLHVAYLIGHPEKINDFVAGRVRRSAGLCTRTKLRDGKWVFVDKTTGDQFEEIKIADLARGTLFAEDNQIHPTLYGFLCEFAHLNIMSLTSYLDGNKFDEADQHMTTQATIYATLYACLVLDAFVLFKPLKKQFRSDLQRFLVEAKTNLQAVFSLMKSKGKWAALLESLKTRLNHSFEIEMSKARQQSAPSGAKSL